MLGRPWVKEWVILCRYEDAGRADAGYPDNAIGIIVQLTHCPVTVNLAGKYFVQLLQLKIAPQPRS